MAGAPDSSAGRPATRGSAALAALETAEFLWDREEWDGCITECLRSLWAEPGGELAFYAAYRGGLSFLMAGQPSTAATWLQRALVGAPAPYRSRIKLQLAVAYAASGAVDPAELAFFELSARDSSLLSANAALLQGVLAVEHARWPEARASLARARSHLAADGPASRDFDEVDSLLAGMIRRPRVRNPALARWLSTFVPGSGQIYAGDYPGGVWAAGYVGVSSWLLYQEASSGTVLEIYLLFSSLWLRSYLGARAAAGREAGERNLAREQLIRERIRERLAGLAERGPALSLDFRLPDVLPRARR